MVHSIVCLDPQNRAMAPEESKIVMRRMLHSLVGANRLPKHMGDEILHKFEYILLLVPKGEFLDFKPEVDRLNTFL